MRREITVLKRWLSPGWSRRTYCLGGGSTVSKEPRPPFSLCLGWRESQGHRERQREALGEFPHPCQFLLLGVSDGHFQHQLWRNLEELGVIAVGLEQEWQDIEAAPWGFPALLYADLQPEVSRSRH